MRLSQWIRLFISLCLLTFVLPFLSQANPYFDLQMQRVSIDSSAAQGNSHSSSPMIAAEGHYIAFTSDANNLVPNDNNNVFDIFVRDTITRTTERVSLSSLGVAGNDWSSSPALSADGRLVSFYSHASNLVPNDSNGQGDFFVYDRDSASIERVSVSSAGTEANANSVLLMHSSLSADGRYITFASTASNLVLDDTNHAADIFVHDRQTGVTERISLANNGTEGNSGSEYPSISADGRWISFLSYATTLVSDDTNGYVDIFIHDRQTGVTERIKAGTIQGNGNSNEPTISADGNFIAFSSYASNLVPNDSNGTSDIFLYERLSQTISRVSSALDGTQGNGAALHPTLAANGRYLSFESAATNLSPDDTNTSSDIFWLDRLAGHLVRLSLADDGHERSGNSTFPSLAANGQRLAFVSEASLVADDNNGKADIFLVAISAPHYDIDEDGLISPHDAIFIVNRLGQNLDTNNQRADVNRDGVINQADIELVLVYLGK